MRWSKAPLKPIDEARVMEVFEEGTHHSMVAHGGDPELIDFNCPECQRIALELLKAFDMTAEESIPHLRQMGSKFVGLIEKAGGRKSAWDS